MTAETPTTTTPTELKNTENAEIDLAVFKDKTGDIEIEMSILGGKFVFKRPGLREKLRIASVSSFDEKGNIVLDWERAANYILPLMKSAPSAFYRLANTTNIREISLQRLASQGVNHSIIIALLTLFLDKMNETQKELEETAGN